MANSLCSVVPLPSPPSFGDPGSTLKSQFEKHCFRQAAVTETVHPAALGSGGGESSGEARKLMGLQLDLSSGSPAQGWDEIIRENSSTGQHLEQKHQEGWVCSQDTFYP